MTRIGNSIPNFIYEPIKKYPVNSPLYWKTITDIKQLRAELHLKGWAEVELRVLHKDWSPAYYFEWEKMNFTMAKFIRKHYPDAHVTFESSANMLEFDTGICYDYEELMQWLQTIQEMKEAILQHFDVIEGKAFVENKELEYEFVNPIHDKVLLKLSELWGDLDQLLLFLYDLPDNLKADYGLDFYAPEWVKYLLTIQSQLPNNILNYTKTTAQQLTLSTNNFSDTLWLDQQLLNYITYYYYEHNQSYAPRTDERSKQWEKVVTYRSENKIGIKWWYRPIAPWSVYYSYLKRTYFDNKKIDWYALGHVPSSMSHGPVSLKFSLNEHGELLPRSEFRLQDSASHTLDAQKNIDMMLMNFVRSAYAQFPKYEYIKRPL